MIWRIYLSDEGTLRMNYLFVSVRTYSSDEYLSPVEGSENVPKTKRCTEKSHPSQVAKIFSYFQESSARRLQSILICGLTFCVQRVVHNGHGLLHGCISQRTKASVPSLI
ncbi:unnamed protein product [Prunus brigantina]